MSLLCLYIVPVFWAFIAYVATDAQTCLARHVLTRLQIVPSVTITYLQEGTLPLCPTCYPQLGSIAAREHVRRGRGHGPSTCTPTRTQPNTVGLFYGTTNSDIHEVWDAQPSKGIAFSLSFYESTWKCMEIRYSMRIWTQVPNCTIDDAECVPFH